MSFEKVQKSVKTYRNDVNKVKTYRTLVEKIEKNQFLVQKLDPGSCIRYFAVCKIYYFVLYEASGDDFQKTNQFFLSQHCSIDLQRQLKHSGRRPDTSSHVITKSEFLNVRN